MHAIMLLTAALSWCSVSEWSDKPDRCLARAGLQERYEQLETIVHGISKSLNVVAPSVRPGSLHDEADRLEVWHIGEGRFEIRIRPDVLRDASDDTLLAVSAHEICHIINGDAGYGTWDSWTEEKRVERQRVAWACAYAIIGADVFGQYLHEADSDYTSEQVAEILRTTSHDSTWWLEWRRKKRLAVP